ncbi:MAG TPA: hypothetical protein VK779_06575 [Rhizomicrobium sp.]|jgi:hypothetical protein|nr:hypothetical protein [Rhizomicrobium sp.]
MKFAALGFAICTTAVLVSCATPYQSMGLRGGVSATQIDNDTLRISGRGNGFTDPATIQNYVLVKAAQETMARHFVSFEIVGDRDTSRGGAVVLPGTATSYTTGNATAYGYGNTATAYGTSTTNTTYMPPQAIPFVKPGEDVIVKMHADAKPAGAPPNWYNASEVIFYLCPQVKCK